MEWISADGGLGGGPGGPGVPTGVSRTAVELAAGQHAAWTGHDTWLMVVATASVAVIVLLAGWLRLHPFLALTIGAFGVTLGAGTPLSKAVTSFTTGVGDTFGDVGLLIVLGAVLGRMLADSGGINQIVDALTRRVGERGLPWAVTLIAAVVGLPMFFEAGFVVLIPIVLRLAWATGQPLLRVGMPAMVGLATVHALVPPHPGPLVAIDALHADVGLTLLFGLIVAVPCAVVAGPLLTRLVADRVPSQLPAFLADFAPSSRNASGGRATSDGDAEDGAGEEHGKDGAGEERGESGAGEGGSTRRPSFPMTLLTVLLPVLLMLLKTLGDTVLQHGRLHSVCEFLGDPPVALLLSVLLSLITFGYGIGAGRARVQSSLAASLPPVGGILVIVAAGGGYKQALLDSGVGDSIGIAAHQLHMPLLLLAWVVAAIMRTAIGSGSIATVTAAGIIGPLAGGLSTADASLVALSLGSGAAFLGHVNDASFWMFKEYLGLDIAGTLRTWTLSHTVLSVTSLVCVLLMSLVM
jgi:gluconate:H+ symporter, GntP family